MKEHSLPPSPKNDQMESFWRFFDKTLSSSPTLPETNYAMLCEAWRDACQADWIWLFLGDHTNEKEIVMQLVASSDQQILPPQFRVENSHDIVTYCVRTKETTIVNDPGSGSWHSSLGGNNYNIIFADLLRQLVCSKIVCVPLVLSAASPNNPSAPERPAITGSACVYYRRPLSEIPELDTEVLGKMGILTAQSISNSYQALQRDILLELNKAAHDHLTSSRRPPRDICRDYAADVINIIRQYLTVEGVSIFYRDTLRGGVQCLNTTGLIGANDTTLVEEENISEVRYNSGEGITGKCFTTGEPLILVSGVTCSHTPKTTESISGRSALESPAVIYPIPLSDKSVADNLGDRALGVIRCKYHKAHFTGKAICFDAIEIQTLAFIAYQIASVLETFEANISRESVISITKHDLTAPLDFIKYRALKPRLAPGSDLNAEYLSVNRDDIYDFGMCAMLALNLVRQFDANPAKVRDLIVDFVCLEGQVIAPIKNVLHNFAQVTSQMGIFYEQLNMIPKLWLDESHIQQAFFNLVINAIKYGKKRTNIRIVGRESQTGYNVDVINEGVGIETHEESLIFQPGYRSPSVKNSRIGLGLGLTIARACVEKCGGSLYLLARKNPTVFSMFFPRGLANRPHPATNTSKA